MKLRVYLDTSVFSAYHDERTPERQEQTREFWERLGEFEVSTGEITRIEMQRTRDPVRRGKLLGLLANVVMHPSTSEVHALAQQYLGWELFPLTSQDDALHLAVATLTGQEVLLSWNFRHLVSYQCRVRIGEAHERLGLAVPEILCPPEL